MDVCHNCGQRWPLYKRVCPACNHPEGVTEREAKAFLRGQENMREEVIERLVHAANALPESAQRSAASGALLGAATALRPLSVEGK